MTQVEKESKEDKKKAENLNVPTVCDVYVRPEVILTVAPFHVCLPLLC